MSHVLGSAEKGTVGTKDIDVFTKMKCCVCELRRMLEKGELDLLQTKFPSGNSLSRERKREDFDLALLSILFFSVIKESNGLPCWQKAPVPACDAWEGT